MKEVNSNQIITMQMLTDLNNTICQLVSIENTVKLAELLAEWQQKIQLFLQDKEYANDALILGKLLEMNNTILRKIQNLQCDTKEALLKTQMAHTAINTYLVNQII